MSLQTEIFAGTVKVGAVTSVMVMICTCWVVFSQESNNTQVLVIYALLTGQVPGV